MDTYFYAVGRRKSAVVQVRLTPNGSGKIIVNDLPLPEYFRTERMRNAMLAPLKEVGKIESVDITMKIVGGGKIGQADAAAMGVARALVKMDEAARPVMRAHGMLTRDARIKERKKFGKRGARRSPQWRKR